ncbi:hypothetical protein GCM10023083_72110 [Streptomyces phyllanthi]
MTPSSRPGTVLLTDHAWPDDTVERSVIEGAGLTLVTGPAGPASAEAGEELVAKYRPAGILTCTRSCFTRLHRVLGDRRRRRGRGPGAVPRGEPRMTGGPHTGNEARRPPARVVQLWC